MSTTVGPAPPAWFRTALVALLERRDLSGVQTRWAHPSALCVVMASEGYPGSYAKGRVIEGTDQVGSDAVVFHAGTAMAGGKLTASGGRVLNVTARGANVSQAAERAYAVLDQVKWEGGFCRRDIGWRAIEREKA